MSDIEALDDRLHELANLRRQLALAKELEQEAESAFQKTPEFQKFGERNKMRLLLVAQERVAYDLVCDIAKRLYKDTGEKKYPGVSVVMEKSMTYDMEAALAWCKERLPEALTIVKPTFEKVADIMRPDFVTFDEQPKARVASNLSEFLEDTDAEKA